MAEAHNGRSLNHRDSRPDQIKNSNHKQLKQNLELNGKSFHPQPQQVCIQKHRVDPGYHRTEELTLQNARVELPDNAIHLRNAGGQTQLDAMTQPAETHSKTARPDDVSSNIRLHSHSPTQQQPLSPSSRPRMDYSSQLPSSPRPHKNPPNQLPRSPSPRYRMHSDPSSPARSPSPYDFHPFDSSASHKSEQSRRRKFSVDGSSTAGADSSASGVSAPETGDSKSERKTKSVSFHSHTNWKSERKTESAEDCLEYMKDGSSLIKVRSSGRQYHRYFRLLDDLSAIHWTPSSKKMAKAQIAIDQIHEIRTGRNCESLRHQPHPLRYPEDRIFSILYGPDYQSLDLIAYTPEEASVWVTGLNALIGDAASPDASDVDMVPLRDRWLQEVFDQACGSDAGSLDQVSCVRLIQQLDPNVETDRVLHKIQEHDVGKPEKSRGRLTAEEFISSFKELVTRHEISCLLIRFANKDYLTLEDLQVFLEGEQRMSGLTVEQVKEVIDLYEPSSEARSSNQLHIDGFTKYLLSEDCDIFDPRHRTVSQDMTLPLTHYFISSSHNTYLLEDQVKGPCSVDGYIRVLTCGCRCVKVDVHDGPTEPLVYNGLAHTSHVLFREVLEAIATFSFDFSVYPVIVHLENHCSVPQQKLMVDLLTTILGPLLHRPPVPGAPPTASMSPEELKNKVLLKGKKLDNEEVSEGEITDEDENESSDREGRRGSKRRMKLCSELSKLISLTRGDSPEGEAPSADCLNLSEAAAGRQCQSAAEDLVTLNKRLLTRVYPNIAREDSSNYDPQDFWNAGCQLVSLNFQTPGQMMDVYEGKFRSNGGCGYVIKPAVMREHISVFSASSKEPIPGVTPQLLRIKVISAQSLPKPRGSTASKASFLDPYVVIQVLGIPADRREFQTRTVKNNSRFPVFEESFDIELLLPELALVRFVVLDDEYIGDDFIGQCTVPVNCMQPGYRHIRLLSSMGEPMERVTLFVHVAVSSPSTKPFRSKGSKKSGKLQAEMKLVGLKEADELFKEAGTKLQSCDVRVTAMDAAWSELQRECGLELTANLKQCLRVALGRFLTHPHNYTLTIVTDNGVPAVRRTPAGPLPTHLQRLETALDQLLQEIQAFLSSVKADQQELKKCLQPALSLYDRLDSLLLTSGVKGKKANKSRENFAWNVRIIRGQVDKLSAAKERCTVALGQLESTRSTLTGLNRRDRSPSVRDRHRLTLATRHHTTDNLSSYGSLGRGVSSSPSSQHLTPPKSILKKSNSNIESGSMTYVDGDYFSTDFGGMTVDERAGPPSLSGSSVMDEDDEDDDDDDEVTNNGLFVGSSAVQSTISPHSSTAL